MHTIPSKGIVLVDFWAPWCGPCKNMMPVLDLVQQQIKQDFQIIKFNIDDAENDSTIQSLLIEHNVKSIPYFVIYKDGKIIHRLVGIQSSKTIIDLINNTTNP